ncbi:MAG TPA: GGDEF domain-containing protein [Thermoanaerobaculia bacterium]|nr:GGDEF domain-containing protein [Thermoanaerobaculia bacterium]
MTPRSLRLTYSLVGLVLGIFAPVGAFLIRYAFLPHVHAAPGVELATNRFFYAYELVGTCLVFVVAGWIAGLRAEQLRDAESFYHALSEHDALTGLYNARAFRSRYGRLVERSVRTGAPLSLLLIDVDHLKQVNDRFGHTTGNKVLMHVANALREAKRSEDSAARWGGDEFAILLEGADAPSAMRVAENARNLVKSKSVAFTRGLTATITIGACTAMPVSVDTDLFAAADRALYGAKQQGRDRVVAVTIPGV